MSKDDIPQEKEADVDESKEWEDLEGEDLPTEEEADDDETEEEDEEKSK